MATPGASRQPLACTRLPHKRPTSLGALLRLAVAVVALYVPRAVPARRLRTSLHLRRAPRRAWTRRGAAPRFARRLRTPNSLYFMAELTERCGVCAKCQWTCADQPDQTACYACKNGGGKRFFQSRSRTAWNRPPCQKPRTFDFTEMEGVLENKTRQPESVPKSNFTASIESMTWHPTHWLICAQGPGRRRGEGEGGADGEAERKRRSEIGQRTATAKRDATAKYGGKTREETGRKLEGGQVEGASASLRDFDAWVDVGKPKIEPLQGLDGHFFHARGLECMHWTARKIIFTVPSMIYADVL